VVVTDQSLSALLPHGELVDACLHGRRLLSALLQLIGAGIGGEALSVTQTARSNNEKRSTELSRSLVSTRMHNPVLSRRSSAELTIAAYS
jgi:CRISPR/Cas system-associated endonuclease Cas1